MKYIVAIREMATWRVGPSSVGKSTVSAPSITKAMEVFTIKFVDGVLNLLVIASITLDWVTSLTFFLILIFGFLLSFNCCMIILSWADSIASMLGLCPLNLWTKKFLAPWISSSDASLLIPSLLYGSFTLILGNISVVDQTIDYF